MSDDPSESGPALTQLNVRLPHTDRAALKRLAHEGGVSLNALLGAIVGSFLSDQSERALTPLLARARTIDSNRRRPHLRNPTRDGDGDVRPARHRLRADGPMA